MKCPVCNTELTMSERQGIEIDYCPQCRGVWLDRGELDKIIERSTETTSSKTETYKGEHKHQHSPGEHNKYYYKKKKSFLGDLFDFD